MSNAVRRLPADRGARGGPGRGRADRRPVALTAAGERLRRHATLILLRLETARADVTRTLAPPDRLLAGLTPLAWSAPVAVPGGHGLLVLPGPLVSELPGLTGVLVTAPRLVHRVELIRTANGAEPAARLAGLLGA